MLFHRLGDFQKISVVQTKMVRLRLCLLSIRIKMNSKGTLEFTSIFFDFFALIKKSLFGELELEQFVDGTSVLAVASVAGD